MTKKADSRAFPGKEKGFRLSCRRILLVIVLITLLAGVITVAAVEIWPSFGAQVANGMRNVFGPRVVAEMENIVFRAQDTVRQWQYRYGGQKAEAPWEIGTPVAVTTPLAPVVTQGASPSPKPSTYTPTPANDNKTPVSQTQSSGRQTQAPTMIASATLVPTPTPYVWQLANLDPFGTMEGEGIWQPYLYDQEGKVVAMRTFLQPDPARPYTVVAVVALDLTRLRLHFVLGFTDPGLADGPKGDGLIPEEDRQAGVLLAAFNGGFRTANGMYGAMSHGVVALPAVDEIATVGIYQNGDVRMGSWGDAMNESPELEAWRQNCSMIIQDGEISPKVYNDSTVDWGGSISNLIVTRRSGMGLDQDGETLYYFAGPGLSMPALADAMLASGVYNGMLLDINNFWVHFTAIHDSENGLVAEALLPNDMIDRVDRYLGASPVDFFYVTLRESDLP